MSVQNSLQHGTSPGISQDLWVQFSMLLKFNEQLRRSTSTRSIGNCTLLSVIRLYSHTDPGWHVVRRSCTSSKLLQR